MIRYALICDAEHEFEAWFSSSDSYDVQAEKGLVECPHCGTTSVRKALTAPAVSTSRAKETRAEQKHLSEIASQVKAHIRQNFDYVGEDFAREARDMHEGRTPERLIYGEASAEESEKLADEGVPVSPLPDMFAPVPPKKAN